RRRLEARIGAVLPAEVLLSKVEGLPRRERPERIAEIAREAVVALRDRVPFDIDAVSPHAPAPDEPSASASSSSASPAPPPPKDGDGHGHASEEAKPKARPRA